MAENTGGIDLSAAQTQQEVADPYIDNMMRRGRLRRIQDGLSNWWNNLESDDHDRGSWLAGVALGTVTQLSMPIAEQFLAQQTGYIPGTASYVARNVAAPILLHAARALPFVGLKIREKLSSSPDPGKLNRLTEKFVGLAANRYTVGLVHGIANGATVTALADLGIGLGSKAFNTVSKSDESPDRISPADAFSEHVSKPGLETVSEKASGFSSWVSETWDNIFRGDSQPQPPVESGASQGDHTTPEGVNDPDQADRALADAVDDDLNSEQQTAKSKELTQEAADYVQQEYKTAESTLANSLRSQVDQITESESLTIEQEKHLEELTLWADHLDPDNATSGGSDNAPEIPLDTLVDIMNNEELSQAYIEYLEKQHKVILMIHDALIETVDTNIASIVEVHVDQPSSSDMVGIIEDIQSDDPDRLESAVDEIIASGNGITPEEQEKLDKLLEMKTRLENARVSVQQSHDQLQETLNRDYLTTANMRIDALNDPNFQPQAQTDLEVTTDAVENGAELTASQAITDTSPITSTQGITGTEGITNSGVIAPIEGLTISLSGDAGLTVEISATHPITVGKLIESIPQEVTANFQNFDSREAQAQIWLTNFITSNYNQIIKSLTSINQDATVIEAIKNNTTQTLNAEQIKSLIDAIMNLSISGVWQIPFIK